MSAETLALRYIESAEKALEKLEVEGESVEVSKEDIEKVLASAKAYLADARYYRHKKEFEVSLTSVAYCEGLLDGLRMLGAVRFEWPSRGTEK